MLKTKKQLISVAVFSVVLFTAPNLFARTRVSISYSSGASFCSPPVRTYYVYRPAVIYTVPSHRYVTVCDTPRISPCNSGFAISYNSGFDRDRRSNRYYYNPPRSYRFDHRRDYLRRDNHRSHRR